MSEADANEKPKPVTIADMTRDVRRVHRGAFVTDGKAGERVILTRDKTKILGRGKSSREAWRDAWLRLKGE